MELFAPAAAGQRARGHVEPALNRQGNVQTQRPERHSASGDHHQRVHGQRPGENCTAPTLRPPEGRLKG